MKILCVLLPHFPLRCEYLRHPEISGRKTILTRSGPAAEGHKLVLDYSPELDRIQPDMPLQQALSYHGEAEIVQADVPYYWSEFNILLDKLEQKSPLVEGIELGLAYLGVDGLQLIYPTNKALINAMREVIPETYRAQIGIAEGKFSAYLAALYSPPGGYRILSGDSGSFLKDLPCDVLPTTLKNKSKLHTFGLHTLGQIAALPPGPIQTQFGPEGKSIRQLASGNDDTPLYPRLSRETIEENTSLVSITTSIEAILVSLETLLARAFARINARGMGIRNLNIWTRTWNAELWDKNIRFKDPAMNVKSAMPRVKQVLESYLQPGPVEQLGIKVTQLGYGNGRQGGLFPEIRAHSQLHNDIKQLELRLGGPQIFQVKEVEPWSRIPERRYILAPVNR